VHRLAPFFASLRATEAQRWLKAQLSLDACWPGLSFSGTSVALWLREIVCPGADYTVARQESTIIPLFPIRMEQNGLITAMEGRRHRPPTISGESPPLHTRLLLIALATAAAFE